MNCDKCHFAAIWEAQGFGSWALQNVASLAPCEKKLLLSIHPVSLIPSMRIWFQSGRFRSDRRESTPIYPLHGVSLNAPTPHGFDLSPRLSPPWGASLVLICEVCQDLPSHNTAREWITPSVNELNLLLLLLNIAVRGVCVCSVQNWIRPSAADVACQLDIYEQHFIDWEYFMYNE